MTDRLVVAGCCAMLALRAFQLLNHTKLKSTNNSLKTNNQASTKHSENDETIIPTAGIDIYESAQSLHEYLLMHYATSSQLFPFTDVKDVPTTALDFPVQTAKECIRQLNKQGYNYEQIENARILEVGCAVGRSAFELARYCQNVVALDYSHSFIAAANLLKERGELKYEMRSEGELLEDCIAVVDPSIDRSRAHFTVGDACNLNVVALTAEGRYDCLLAANLLCRLPFPLKFLRSVKHVLKVNGLLVMPSPSTWLESYTHKSHWLGGYRDSEGRAVYTFDTLKRVLGEEGFQLVDQLNMPFFIRETHRKNQFTISHCTVWKLLK